MKQFPGYFLWSLLLSGQILFAQKADSVLNKTQQLEDVVITAEYVPKPIDQSTYKVKVIDDKKIIALAAVTLKDALSNELNIRFSQDPVLGSSLSLQGLSGQNVKILVDGVSMIGRQNGNLDLSQINVNNIERIEIIEGPMSVSYGTNALAGAINIITKKPKANSLDVNANVYYETNNTYNAGIGFAIKRKAHGVSLNAARNYFNGWNKSDKYYFLPEETLADTNRFKSWKPKEQYFGDLQYTFEKNKFKLNYRSSYFNETVINRGFPLKPYYETAFDDYYRTQRFDNTLYTNIKFKNFHSYNNTFAYSYFNRIKNTYYKDLTNLKEQLSPDYSLQDTAVFNQIMARGTFVCTKPFTTWNDTVMHHNYFNYEIGYDLNYSTALGKRIKNKEQAIGDYAVFASAEIQPVKNLIFRPGLRYAYNTIYSSPLIPSINVKYNRKNWTIRTSYAKGFRAPDLKELYFEFVDINHNIIGNTNLKAEQSDNYNLNLGYKKRTEKNEVSVDLSGFYNDINNLITLAIISGTKYSYVNIGKFKSYGTNINWSYGHKPFVLSCGGGWVARYNDLSETNKDVVEFSYTPEARASAQFNLEKQKLSFNCFYKYSGKLPGYVQNSDGSVSQTFIGDYHILDANVVKQLFKERLNISIGVKNIMDVNNINANLSGGVHSGSAASTPVAMGRTYFIKLQYAFTK